MSFRLADLKKSVRKSKDGYQVTPARLDDRQAAFKIEFVLQQFEAHLGQPRRELDPELILDFIGDSRLGRGLLATLSQWYRMRPRTFAEVLDGGGATPERREHLLGLGITGPVELRAWLFAAVNRGGAGFLDPDAEAVFWQAQARALKTRRTDLQALTLLDRPEEAVLVRTGPRPTAADVMAAYNARAHTTLLRTAREVSLKCAAGAPLLERAARAWAAACEVEWRIEGQMLTLLGRADALGCWTRHGRRVERAALELLALPDLDVREIRGRLQVSEKSCGFLWKADTLAALGAGAGARLHDDLPAQITDLAASLRRQRDQMPASGWTIRRPAQVVGVERGVCLPHLELRRDDWSLFLRLTGPEPGDGGALVPFRGKTPIAAVTPARQAEWLLLQLSGDDPALVPAGDLLAMLGPQLASLQAAARPAETRRPLKKAA